MPVWLEPLVDLLAQYSLNMLRGVAMSQGEKNPRQWSLGNGPLCPHCLRKWHGSDDHSSAGGH